MLTRKQHDLLLFIHQKLRDEGVSPSFEEMKEALALKSKSGVHRLINALEERNFIKRFANRARALEVLRLPDAAAGTARPTLIHDSSETGNVVRGNFRGRAAPAPATLEIPLHGRIAAGQPIMALESTATLAIPPTLVGAGEHFALEVAGDSMVEAGILDGDYAIIRKADLAEDGDIVVALVEREEATLKTLRRRGGKVLLEPANAAYATQVYNPRQVSIQGRMVALLRRY